MTSRLERGWPRTRARSETELAGRPARQDACDHGNAAASATTRQVVAVLLFNLAGYFLIGLPIAVVPSLVHETLGFGVVMAGAAVSSQYLATLLSRAWAGRLCDVRGPKIAVQRGMLMFAGSGVCMLAAGFGLAAGPALGTIIVARLLLGVGESLVTTGATTWGIARAGAGRTARVISWNGLTSFGGMAAGAPVGAWLAQSLGWQAIGVATAALAAFCLVLAQRSRGALPAPGKRMGFAQVLSSVLPFGLCLALGGMGFGAITSFIALYYAHMGWTDAAFALSVLGIAFALARLLLADAAPRFGGYCVAFCAFAGETLGLLMLWQASSPLAALAGVAITGFCFAPLFPALGMVAVQPVPGASRGSAISVFALFFDLGLGATGPLAGLVAARLGYAAVYLFAALAALAGLACAVLLRRRRPARP
ncbi:MFS transporter [Noviherbaspirillum pedocola]|uniref:MFS transporter n=1 Tax=Noviherbaspirillum pedocola TaxID=2801341 RepID=A0A934STV6_9BURK|nr:MFS transporter [Noviherbaspirillum pedocola]MBK4736681.1 MFS transporter [Noviherbaspirillum pedocola]